MYNTIGFFGDSFCAERANNHSVKNNYKTYIDLVASHYNANIVNLGKGGSSVYDTILLQLQPLIESNTVPNVCIFVWTNSGRLFHRDIRNINHTSAINYKPSLFTFLSKHIWNSAKQYYEQLYDYEKEELEYRATLKYIDDCILKKLPASTKIIHLWSFATTTKWHEKDVSPATINYPHTWNTGIEIRPALISISLADASIEELHVDHRCNHISGTLKNTMIFNWIKTAIDDQSQHYDYSTDVNVFYDTNPVVGLPAI